MSWWSLSMQVIIIGYLFAFMQSIIQSTAVGEDEMPPLPGMGNFWEDIVLPGLQFIGLGLICFGPAILLGWFVIASEESGVGPAVLALVVLGGFYFPMAFLSVAMLDSVVAANPLQVIPSIIKVPGEYIVTVIVLAIVMALRELGGNIIPVLFPKGLDTKYMSRLFGFLGTEIAWSIISIYLLVVGMRILGLLYLTKRQKLGWLAK
jgi:hypothetical protein